MKTLIRVLLIEHSEETTAMIGDWLHRAERAFDLHCVDRLQLGLQALASQNYDAVIANLDLPDSAGIEGLIRLKVRTVGTPVLVLSDAQANGAVQPLIQAGAQECLDLTSLNAVRLESALNQAIARQQSFSRISELSTLDALTQLYNRRGFMQAAGRQINRARRQQQPFVLLLADLDELNQINRQYGSAAGDRALEIFAQALREVFRSSDILARLGEDEFAVLACEAHPDSAELLRKRLQFRLDKASVLKGLPAMVTCSIGSALWLPSRNQTLELLLREADVALYEHKLRFGPRAKPLEKQRFKPLALTDEPQHAKNRLESIRHLREVLQVVKEGADYLTHKGSDEESVEILDDVTDAVTRADAIIRDLEV